MHPPGVVRFGDYSERFIKYSIREQEAVGVAVTRLVWDRPEDTFASSEGVREQTTFDASNGCPALRQRIVRLEQGATAGATAFEGDEVLFVLEGRGFLRLGGAEHLLEPETGAFIRHGETYELESDGQDRLVVVAVEVPDPPTGVEVGERRVTLRLDDSETQAATANREFRLVVTPDAGCPSLTQFVGYIPVGRAPDHFHTYDEVLYLLSGQGVLHIGDSHEPVGAGACIHLSPRLVHSLENSGPEPMQVLGVFRPAGSPSEAYYPDGTLATY
jgi:mannose-6-phosphate isomerase-like protein (cupin superfamily)